MKKYSILGFVAGAALVFAACEPIEERLTLSNSYDPNSIDLEVVHSSPGSNKFKLVMKTPGVTGYWDYNIGERYSNEVEVIYPFTGEATFTFHATIGYIPDGDLTKVNYNVQKTITTQVTKMDTRLADAYYHLVGENLEGKAWVFDFDDPVGWWYMTDESWEVFWWQPDLEDNEEAHGKIVFNLDGGPNYLKYSQPDAEPVKGRFAFNANCDRLTIQGDVNLLGALPGTGAENNTGSKEYQIIELTADRMVLFQTNMAWSPGWVWVFKPE